MESLFIEGGLFNVKKSSFIIRRGLLFVFGRVYNMCKNLVSRLICADLSVVLAR